MALRCSGVVLQGRPSVFPAEWAELAFGEVVASYGSWPPIVRFRQALAETSTIMLLSYYSPYHSRK
jgi:hypothetical protein